MTRQYDKNLSEAVSNAIIIIAAVNHILCDTAPWLILAVQARKKVSIDIMIGGDSDLAYPKQ
jgi:hypothetical protein